MHKVKRYVLIGWLVFIESGWLGFLGGFLTGAKGKTATRSALDVSLLNFNLLLASDVSSYNKVDFNAGAAPAQLT
jgi:hypothetical protein